MRQLLTYLLSFDAVSFNQFLETILASNTTNLTTGRTIVNQSPWLFLPAADIIFETARNRVYKKVAVQLAITDSNGTNGQTAIVHTPCATRAESEDPYWDLNDDSVFTDKAMLDASRSEPALSNPTNSMSSETKGVEPLVHDLTNSDDLGRSNIKTADVTARRPNPASHLPGDLSGEGTPSSMQPWAYWCPEGTVPVLEEQPKWFLLREILEEIEAQIHWSPRDYGKCAK